MHRIAICCALIGVAVLAGHGMTTEPGPVRGPILGDPIERGSAPEPLATLFTVVDEQPPKEQPKVKGKPAPDMPPEKIPLPGEGPPELQNIFDQPQQQTSDISSGFNPQMMGDQGAGYFARQLVYLTGLKTLTTFTTITTATTTFPDESILTTTTTSTSSSTSVTKVKVARVVITPIVGLGAFKVAENESPRPQDRVFGFFNYYNGLQGPDIGSGTPLFSSQTSSSTVTKTSADSLTSTATTSSTTSTTTTPGFRPQLNLFREVAGFEKTFLNGRASVEMRLPLLQQQGNGPIPLFLAYDVGDITIVTKYAFILDPVTNNVLSAGMALTLPTGPGINTVIGTLHPTLWQPWGGYIWNFNRFYIQGIHSVVLPTDTNVATLLFNDVGLNVWAYRGRPTDLLSFVVPVIEGHVTTPLNHRSVNDPLTVPDIFVLTGGIHFGFYRNTVLTLGAAGPLTGPTPFNVEMFAQLNWRF